MDHDEHGRLQPAPRTVPIAAAAASDAGLDWLDVCAVDDVPLQGARVLKRPRGGDVALFRSAAGAVFALLDRCPHKGGPLSQGIVFGERVACPLHNWSIGLADGQAAAPDVGCARPFAVRVADGRVWMDAVQLRAAD
ncbi:MAG: nitrite reductase small subunit NirD [Burkholderiales bacterium]|nr:MAG: nitrite reductase small subunit NirD [Burkholderiales bacterium]